MLGISGDSPFSHGEFQKRNTLPFPLLSDVHRKVIQAAKPAPSPNPLPRWGRGMHK